MVKAYRAVVSRPDPEREKLSSGSGPVKTYKMSPEEMEDHLARIGANKASVHVGSKHPSIVEPKAEVVDKRKTAKEIDQQEVIRLIAEGLTYHKVEEKVGIPKGTLRYRLKKWDLVGLDQIKAKAMLVSVQVPEAHEAQNTSLKDYEKKLAEWDSLNEELQRYKVEAMNLRRDLSESKAALESSQKSYKGSLEHIKVLEDQLQKWNDNDSETQALLLEVIAERDKWERAASITDADYGKATKRLKELEILLAEMTEDRDNWKQTAQEAKQAVVELEAEYRSIDSQIVGTERSEQIPDTFEELGLQIGALVADKNAAYGDSFAKTGEFLKLLYPTGIQPHQFKDALCLVRIFDKQMRIATDKDAFGESPYRDIVGYGLLGVMKIGGMRRAE